MNRSAVFTIILILMVLGACNCNKQQEVTTQAAPAVQQSAVKPEAPATAQSTPTASPPDMKVGTLQVDKIVAKESQTELAKVKESQTGLAKVRESRTALAKVKESRTKLAKIVKAEIREANIDKANIREAEIDKAKIRLAEIELAKIKKAEIELVEIEKAKIKLAEIELAKIKKAEIEKANIGTEPLVKMEKVSKVALKCDNKDCWPRNPKGNYFSLGKLGDAILFGNINNPLHKANSVSAKIEKDSGVWVRKVAVRNPTTTPKALLIPGLYQEIQKHFQGIPPKDNREGKNGDSCFEKTWVVDPDKGTFYVPPKK